MVSVQLVFGFHTCPVHHVLAFHILTTFMMQMFHVLPVHLVLILHMSDSKLEFDFVIVPVNLVVISLVLPVHLVSISHILPVHLVIGFSHVFCTPGVGVLDLSCPASVGC